MSILVIDTETTGLGETDGRDRVLEVGIAELNEVTGKVSPVYGEVIRYPDIKEVDEAYVNERDGSKGIWIYRHSDLSIEDTLYARKDLPEVVDDVRRIVEGRTVTSYNIPFDFDRFLFRDPWNLRDSVELSEDIMDMASERVYEMADSDAIRDKGMQRYLLEKREKCTHDRCWVKSCEAYRVLCPDDPMGLGNQTHRALDDAMMEGHILRALLK